MRPLPAFSNQSPATLKKASPQPNVCNGPLPFYSLIYPEPNKAVSKEHPVEFAILVRFSISSNTAYTGYQRLLIAESNGTQAILELHQIVPDKLGPTDPTNAILLSSPLLVKTAGTINLSVLFSVTDKGPCSQEHVNSIGEVTAQ